MDRVACFVMQGSAEAVNYHCCICRKTELNPAKLFLTWVVIIVAEKNKIKWEIGRII